jgi:hypothetical protein
MPQDPSQVLTADGAELPPQREWLTSATITAFSPRTDGDSGSQLPNNRGFPVQNHQSG